MIRVIHIFDSEFISAVSKAEKIGQVKSCGSTWKCLHSHQWPGLFIRWVSLVVCPHVQKRYNYNTNTTQNQHRIQLSKFNTKVTCTKKYKYNDNSIQIQCIALVICPHMSLCPNAPFLYHRLSKLSKSPPRNQKIIFQEKFWSSIDIKEERTPIGANRGVSGVLIIILDTMTKMMTTAFGLCQAGWH